MSRETDPSSRPLTTTSYALLAQLSVRPWSTYELAQQRVRYFRFVWPRAESAIYRETKLLAKAGLAETRTEHTGKRKRTIYSITEKGISALKDWLDTPVSPFAMEFEGLIRLFIAPLGTTDQLITTLEQVKADARDMLAFAGEVKAEFLEGREAVQDQTYIRALGVDFFISFLNTVDAWADRTTHEVRQWEGMTLEEKNRRGIEIFSKLPVESPTTPPKTTPRPPATQHRPRR